MTGRVGITTNLIGRRAHWESVYPATIRNWRVVHTFYSKSEAQAHETKLAKLWGCESHQGGGGTEFATWHVYYFEHDGA